jgi:hypothetical protein
MSELAPGTRVDIRNRGAGSIVQTTDTQRDIVNGRDVGQIHCYEVRREIDGYVFEVWDHALTPL